MNGTTVITYDNGTTVVPQPGSALYNAHNLNMIEKLPLGNSTWMMYNSTSRSISTITFHEEMIGGFMHNNTWTGNLNGHTYSGHFVPPFSGYEDLQLCHRVGYSSSCVALHPITASPNHIEFKDPHGRIIHLMR